MKRLDHYRQSVLWDPELTTAEKLLLLSFAEFMDFDTLGGAHPGRTKLARLASVSPRHVPRLAGSVIRKGWLVEAYRGGSPKGGRRMASVYRGTIPDRWRDVTGQTGRPVTSDAPDQCSHVTPPSQRPADDAATAGAASPSAQPIASSSNGKHPKGCSCSACHWGSTATLIRGRSA